MADRLGQTLEKIQTNYEAAQVPLEKAKKLAGAGDPENMTKIKKLTDESLDISRGQTSKPGKG